MSDIPDCIDGTLPPARDYKRRWQEIPCSNEEGYTNLTIRIHRSCSWLGRAQVVARDSSLEGLDDQLIFLWISFNALYGQWDKETNHPAKDIRGVRSFIAQADTLDQEHGPRVFQNLLVQHRALAERLFDNVYLDHYFWRGLEEGAEELETWQNMPRKGRLYLDEGQTQRALDRLLLYRVYQLRCQLIHGGGTHGGRLNRESIADCGRFLHLFLDRSFEILLHQERAPAFREGLGSICYPPIQGGQPPGTAREP
ncbi:MAG: hypothetical protein VX641_02045 [Planctomycetota bacterium]|nr:hypothetical protein [Planctomycetota bacterium]